MATKDNLVRKRICKLWVMLDDSLVERFRGGLEFL